MTSEICIMNRYAVALAADSATTVTQWVNGQHEERYFKGANKIFQLSNYHPVGLMIYDSASLQRAPWEVIIKAFRTELKQKSFNTLEGYCQELFDFISGHQHLFSQTQQEKIFREEAITAAYRYLANAESDDLVRNAADDVEKRTAHAALFAARRTEVMQTAAPAFCLQADIDAAIVAHAAIIEAEITTKLTNWGMIQFVDVPALVEVAVNTVFKFYKECLSATGLVVAGYGDHDYFPSFREYQIYGMLLGHLVVDFGGVQEVSYEQPAQIKPFATTSMVDTFQMGFSMDVYGSIKKELIMVLKDFAEKIAAALGQQGAAVPNLDILVSEAAKWHSDRWTGDAMANHAWPLRRVVGSLPVDEMADLAETLINLQSVKEKVTKPTESVGGPVDVAVITKSDGFIWIKRKHYFDPKLNPRFFVRQRDMS